MRGFSNTSVCGNVGDPIRYGETGSGEQACTFMVCCEGRGSDPTWVKVNVYGDGNVNMCRNRSRPGTYVVVRGSLMNRMRDGSRTTEIRAEEIIFVPAKQSANPEIQDQKEQS